MTNSRTKKWAAVGLAVVLVSAGGLLLRLLNRERAELGLTDREPLQNAPPVLALTTQVLGGFRGLIANALWIRATDMQDEGKYFEMVQLADWITKLEPHFVQVWLVQAWNMAYNISVKFSEYPDRWRWVQRGIELLRDDGLRYNPHEPLIYRELAWFFQHKMGQNLDDAHVYYKGAWAAEMTRVFGGERPDFERLINPQTPDEHQRAELLRDKYKMNPAKMRDLDRSYGPLDWRLPEAHAIYWASVGIDESRPGDLLPLRRVIYQSMNLAFQRGRLVMSSNLPPRLLPNLDIIDQANKAFEDQIAADAEKRDAIQRAHKNFLREVPYQLFIHNRVREGEKWLRYVREKYPDAIPADVTLSEYAVSRALENAQEQSQSRMTALVEAMVLQSYVALIEGREDEANEYMQRAYDFANVYAKRVEGSARLAIPPVDQLKQIVLRELLDPQRGLPPESQARLRTLVPNAPPPAVPK